jgi:hypothetical protein
MNKYNVIIFSLSDIDTSDLDALIDSYDMRILGIENIGKYDYYNYIISEDDIIGFLAELPYDYIVKYVYDDILDQININTNTNTHKRIDIYRNTRYDKKPKYKILLNETENEIYNMCKYIEKNNKI